MTETRVKNLVLDLENLSNDFIQYNNSIKDHYNLLENDVRFSYFRMSHHTVDAAIHLLIMSDMDTQDREYLKRVYTTYPIVDRFELYSRSLKPTQEILFTIAGQLLISGFFSSMYHLFENAFRILCQCYDSTKYDNQKGKLGNIFPTFMKQFKRDTSLLNGINTQVFEYIEIVRNSIHNNGVYVDRDKNDRNNILNLEKKRVTIFHGRPIPAENGVWYEIIKMSTWFMLVIGGIIGVPKIASIQHVEDPSQVLVKK